MTNSPFSYDAGVEAALNAFGVLLNGGSLRIYTGSQPAVNGPLTGTLLVTLSFGSPAFGNATTAAGSGSAPANGIPSAMATGSGSAGYFALVEPDTVTVVGTGSCGLSGSDLNLSVLTIVAGTLVTCSAFALSQSQS